MFVVVRGRLVVDTCTCVCNSATDPVAAVHYIMLLFNVDENLAQVTYQFWLNTIWPGLHTYFDLPSLGGLVT